MKLTPDQVAVVTGAASGIGCAIARKLLARGLSVVLVDVERAALDAAMTKLLDTAGSEDSQMSVVVDVSDYNQVHALAATVIARFGRVDLLVNNAGVVSANRPVWEQTRADFDWIMGVNFDGVVNGIRAFVPHMLHQSYGHVVNTSSIAALTVIRGGGNGPYAASKHAVVGLSEVLREDLSAADAPIGVSVLCPGPVATRIRDAARNRPVGKASISTSGDEVNAPSFAHAVHTITAEEAADSALEAVEKNQFWVLTNADNFSEVEVRWAEICTDAMNLPSTDEFTATGQQ